MKYVIGIDGGGTKTEGILCSETGQVFGFFTGGPSNHQFIAAEEVRKNIGQVIEELLSQSGLTKTDISGAYLGLAGDDSKEDGQFLSELLAPIMGGIPFCVRNDLWSAMASVPDLKWGAVVISGTGFNLAVRGHSGQTYTLRALEYEHGNLSTTDQLVRSALHSAFQSEEHTGRKTRLEKRIPETLGVLNMEEVLRLMQKIPEKVYGNGKIAQDVFALARSGDVVCQDILVHIGEAMGEMTGRLIRHVGLDKEEIPIVLSGSILVKSVSRLHLDAMQLAIRKHVPDFQMIMNLNPPAAGACAQALRNLGKNPGKEFFLRVKEICR